MSKNNIEKVSISELNLKKNTFKKLSNLIEKINDKPMGKEITCNDLISFTINNFSDESVEKIRLLSYSEKDKTRIKFLNLQKKSNLSEEELLEKLMGSFDDTI